jgi:CBS domain-containing protein
LPWYILLGVLCGLAAVGFSRALYFVEDLFELLPIEDTWWPAIGALGLGIIGFFVPRVLGVGYDTISDILTGSLGLKLLLIVMLAKSAALLVSLGSGTSGGLLAPMFMSSAAMGGAFAMGVDKVFPHAGLAPAAFALVAMGAVFGASARATFTFIIFAFEITRDYNSVLPLMLVSVIADGIAVTLMPHSSIMTEKLARRGLRINTEYEPDVLTSVLVADTMVLDAPKLSQEMSVRDVADRIAQHDPILSRHHGILVVDDQGKLVGIMTRGDVMRALQDDPTGSWTLLDASNSKPIVAYPDETLFDAAGRMLRNKVGRLPVVSRDDPREIVGYLGRSSFLEARMRRMHEEHVREEGWVGRLRTS